MKTKKVICGLLTVLLTVICLPVSAMGPGGFYQVGVGDVLEINVLQPDPLTVQVTVAPDGSISFPYIGRVEVMEKGLTAIQSEIEKRLSDGYVQYPVVVVYLKESKSLKFVVSGEVTKPGSYTLEPGTTLVRAISIGGGLTKYGSANNVKILRKKESGKGYETIAVNLKAAMNGDSSQDIPIQGEDVVVVSEGLF